MSIIAYIHIRALISVDIVSIFKSLADENRIRILNLLRNGELCVCDIEAVLGVKQSNASRHLNKLKMAEIIVSEKNPNGFIIDLIIPFFQSSPSF
ncbi:MAG: metalloregulator ArsR/SmtB family transcription factor [Methanosarcina barkeri]|nr:metalloregulator ArsR/SmtB family transcription factor [Methanosarcina sp. ERenArc_MAG2]